MGKLIDADVFDSILQDAQAECKKNGGNFRFGVLNGVRANLANQPTVDAALVVHGRWIDENPDDFLDPRMRCSICTGVESPLVKWRYCPNCGAKMDGERRDGE